MRSWLLPLVSLLVACEGRTVEIEVFIPGPDSVDAPVAHLSFIALPYDRDSLLATFEARSPRPADVTRGLDSLFERFRDPFARYAGAAYRVEKLERSLGTLKVRLDSLSRDAPAYATLYREFAAKSDSLVTAHRERDQTQADLDRVRAAISPRTDSLRTLMNEWKSSAYRGYDTLTDRLNNRIGREPIADSTGVDGRVRIRLPGGRWWIYARSWDAWDPNREWYWNVPVTGERVVLDRNSGERRPRY